MTPAEPRNAEQTAMEKRLDVLMAKRSTEATARSLGLTKTTRFINVLNVGYQNKSNTGESNIKARIAVAAYMPITADMRWLCGRVICRGAHNRLSTVSSGDL